MRILQAWQGLAVVGVLAGALVACSDDRATEQAGPEELRTVAGVAAIGAPIVGGEVDLICGTGVTRSTSTDDRGAWSATVPGAALPCAARVSGGMAGAVENGEVFYSFSQSQDADQIVNLTPLTSLGMAQAVQGAVGQDLATWFERADLGDTLQQVNATLASAQAAVNAALSGAGYVLPAGVFNAFSEPFAAIAGTPYDDLLEILARALASTGGSYAELFASFSGGGALPLAPPATGSSVVYDGTHYQPIAAGPEYRYQTEACEGAYNVVGGGLDGFAAHLLVRVGMLKPEVGSVELEVAALTPGMGTRGPIADGKVQLYLYFGASHQSWTGEDAQGTVAVDFDGTQVRVRGSDILLGNGKAVSFDLTAQYLEAEACQPTPTHVQRAVDAVKAMAGDYPVRLYGAICPEPLQALDASFAGTLRLGEDGSLALISEADSTRSVAISPNEYGFDVPAANGHDYTIHYVAGSRVIRLMHSENQPVPMRPDQIQLVEVRADDGCQAFLKRGMEAVTGDAGSGNGEGLGAGPVAALTFKGIREIFTASVINGGTYVGPAYADGRFNFASGQYLPGSTTEVQPSASLHLSRLPSAPGKYACTSFYEMRISLTLPGAGGAAVNYTSGGEGTCTVEILEADHARSKIRGRFSASLTGYPGNEVVAIDDGYFYFNGY